MDKTVERLLDGNVTLALRHYAGTPEGFASEVVADFGGGEMYPRLLDAFTCTFAQALREHVAAPARLIVGLN